MDPPFFVRAPFGACPWSLHLRLGLCTTSNSRSAPGTRDYVFGFMFQHLCISGSSARSMSPDPHTSIHMYLRILCKPCLRIHVSASICILRTSGRSMSPDPYISIQKYLRILCKIHVSGSTNQHPSVSQDPLQDPCLQAHVSASLHLRILDKIHVSGFMSQHLRISGSSARFMCPIHALAFTSQHPCVSQDPLEDPRQSSDSCLSIFVSFMDSLEDPHLQIHVLASLYLMDSLQDSCLRIHVAASIYILGSCARSMSPESCLSSFVS